MKRILLTIGLALVGYLTYAANTVTYLLPPGGVTNTIPGSAVITKVIVATTTATNATVSLIDAPTNIPSYVLGAYTNLVKYGTNYVSTYTNYWGATETFTNLSLWTLTNTVAASTNNYTVKLSLSAQGGTNTLQSDNLKMFFENGVMVTNTGNGTATMTLQYLQ